VTAELNQLFEEAAEIGGDLAQQVDTATDNIEDIRKNAEKMASQIQKETAEVREGITDLLGRIEKAEDAVEGARREADSALDALKQQAVAMVGEVRDLLARLRAGATEVETRQQAVQQSIDSQMDTARKDFADLAKQLSDFSSETGQRLQAAHASLNTFRQTVNGARTELDQQRNAWREAVNNLEEACGTQAGAWIDDLEELLEAHARGAIDAANVLVDQHNAAMDALHEAFVQKTATALAESLAPLQDALGDLAQVAEKHKGELTASVQTILGNIQALEPELETAVTSMRTTRSLR
jgi:DNA repair exonuclease SbcCD ATPase subunit